MDILDDMDDEPDTTIKSSNFGGPGDYMMMDDDIDSAPQLPRRTEESKQLLNETTGGDALYCEPAPVWGSSPSSEWIMYTILYCSPLCVYRTTKNR